MPFQFPTPQLFSQFQFIDSLKSLRQKLYQHRYLFQGQTNVLIYEVREWKTFLKEKTQKLGAYCRYCDGRLLYQKNINQTSFKLISFNLQHNHSQKSFQEANQVADENRNSHTKKTKKIGKYVKKSKVRAYLKQQKEQKNIYQYFAAQWFINYEIFTRRLIKMKRMISIQTVRQLIKKKNTTSSNMIDRDEEQQIIFSKLDIWNNLIHETLENQHFKYKRLSNCQQHSNIKSFPFTNCLIFKSDQFALKQMNTIIQATEKKNIFLIRRKLKLCSFIKKDSNMENILESSILIAFEMDQIFLPKLLWFGLFEQKLNQLKKNTTDPKDFQAQVKHLMNIFLQLQIISSFQDTTFILEADEALLICFQQIKKIFNSLNFSQVKPQFTFLIHPLIVDMMLEKTNTIKPQIIQSYKHNLRIIKKVQLQDNLLQLYPKTSNKDLSIYFRRFCEMYCLSKIGNNDQKIGINFLTQQFLSKHKLKVPFIQISKLLNLGQNHQTNFISTHELIVLILTSFCKYQELIPIEQNSLNYTNFNVPFEMDFFFSRVKNNFDQSLKNTVHNILMKEQYQFSKVIQLCPRIIIQLIYELIPKACDYLAQKIQLKTLQEKKVIKIKSKFNKQITISVKFNPDNLNNHFPHSRKLWLCSCGFYLQYGVPCEHQINCLLSYNMSFERQISSNWKLKRDIINNWEQNRNIQKDSGRFQQNFKNIKQDYNSQKQNQYNLVSDCLKKILL